MYELLEIGFTNIWTTNFDNAIERNFEERKILTNKVLRDSDFSNININKRVNIFKMNGDITEREKIVATQSDYEQYADTHRIMLMFFKRELISSTFLFVGYSFADNLVLNCLSEISRYLGESAGYHYAILKNKPNDPYFNYFTKDLEKRYHVKVVLVDEYEDIPNLISTLNESIRRKRVFISGAFSTSDIEIEEYSHQISKSLAHNLLANDYRIVNGIGKRFGTHLIGYGNEFLAKEGIKDFEKHLIIKPFVGNKSDAAIKKKALRKKVISQCGAAIFVFGDIDKNAVNGKSGVFEEFQIAHEQHKVIIPILYPGMISEKIWNIVKKT